MSRRLTLNLGLRFERLGNGADTLDREGNLFLSLLNPNPPAGGTVQGYVVPSNFHAAIPTGVTQLGNNTGFLDKNTGGWNPRIGFAYRLPYTHDRMVLRGGYGTYHSQTVGQTILQLTGTPPFGFSNNLVGTANGNASWEKPFPDPIPLPQFVPYSPTTSLNFTIIDPNYRPPVTYRWSTNLQTQLPASMLLEVGYVGTRDLHMVEGVFPNQALLASPSNPIRGVTTNTVANVAQRVPYEGFASNSFKMVDSNANGWYNALQITLSKRLSYGLQFQASYTWSRTLDSVAGLLAGGIGPVAYGDQLHPQQRYGPDSFNRDQRFVLSALYNIPGPHQRNSLLGEVLGDWQIAAVNTVQSGDHLSVTYAPASSVYGTSHDRAELVAGCTGSQLVRSGPVDQKLANYVNTSCFTTPPVIGSDGKALDVGNSGVGIISGPGQVNFDLSLIKHFALSMINERSNLEFRAESFNAFNHPMFGNPNTVLGAALGRITTTIVNPRLFQLALKFNF